MWVIVIDGESGEYKPFPITTNEAKFITVPIYHSKGEAFAVVGKISNK